MKVFIAGGDGFIGRNVSETFASQGYDVVKTSRRNKGDSFVSLDLLNAIQVGRCLGEIRPEVIINCAGVVDKKNDFEDNVRMSKNLLESAAVAGLHIHRFVMCGSAGEYGNVSPEDWPVSEETPLRAVNPYALSKIKEERVVHELASKYNTDAVVARIFNPIGKGMPEKFLISGILRQIELIKSKQSNEIEVSRADALRDYVDIRDVGRAFLLMATREHQYTTYNVGSGTSTSTGELVRCIIEESGATITIDIKERDNEPEQPVASQADISRLMTEFGWKPEISLRETIRGILHYE